MSTKTAIGAALLVGGALLLYFGYTEANSFASDLSETFTGSPTDRSIQLLVGGAVTAVLGALLVFRR